MTTIWIRKSVASFKARCQVLFLFPHFNLFDFLFCGYWFVFVAWLICWFCKLNDCSWKFYSFSVCDSMKWVFVFYWCGLWLIWMLLYYLISVEFCLIFLLFEVLVSLVVFLNAGPSSGTVIVLVLPSTVDNQGECLYLQVCGQCNLI